ncbi:MAG: DUF697 domain-containing protein, partial [Cyanobacteriota bacterium]
ALDHQLERLEQRRLRLAAFGRVGVGKSSLLNAMAGTELFATNVAHGSTRRQQIEPWPLAIDGLSGIDLLDTPGIDEVAAAERQRLAADLAVAADLVLFVVDSDLTSVDLEALEQLLQRGKPLVLVLNRLDTWPAAEQEALITSIRRRLPPVNGDLTLVAVAAAPRRPQLLSDGRVRSDPTAPQIDELIKVLRPLLHQDGALLLAINALREADRFQTLLLAGRLRLGQAGAGRLVGRYAALKAAGVAANPFVMLDLAAGLACDTALVVELSQLYGLPMAGSAARQLLLRLSAQGLLLSGAQLGIQATLSVIRQLLLAAAPLSGGLTLAPAAPVALAQAALAVQTTRRTARLTAMALINSQRRGGARPGALLRRLARQDERVGRWLHRWPGHLPAKPTVELLP